MALLCSHIRAIKSRDSQLSWLELKSCSVGKKRMPIEEKGLLGGQRLNQVLTMSSSSAFNQSNWSVSGYVDGIIGKNANLLWNHGNLVAYMQRKKLTNNKRQPIFFFLRCRGPLCQPNFPLFFFLSLSFYSNLLFLFFHHDSLSQHGKVCHVFTLRLLLIIFIEKQPFSVPFIWYQYVWFPFFPFIFCFVLVDFTNKLKRVVGRQQHQLQWQGTVTAIVSNI